MRAPHCYTIALDPGGRWTGIVGFHTATGYVAGTARTVDRGEAVTRTNVVDVDYLDAIASTLDELAAAVEPTVLIVEAVHAPSGHTRGREGHLTNPAPIIATAVAAGAAITWARVQGIPAVMVTPDGHGSHVAGYPAELLDRGGIPRPNGNRRHERSALDVGWAGALDARLAAAEVDRPRQPPSVVVNVQPAPLDGGMHAGLAAGYEQGLRDGRRGR